MISTSEACKKNVYVRNKKGALKKYGKVRSVVFHPAKPVVVGVVVKRPDLLLMKERKERFVAFDRLQEIEGGLEIIDAKDSWDSAACKRLDVDYDSCIIWDYMPVVTDEGRELGNITDISIDEKTLKIDHIDIAPNSVNRAILGSANISVDMIRGYKNNAIVVKEAVGVIEESGGVAGKAGEAWATAKHGAATTGKKAVETATKNVTDTIDQARTMRTKIDDALDAHEAKKEAEAASGERTGVDKAANLFGKQLGRASHMFKDFKDEYDKASHDE